MKIDKKFNFFLLSVSYKYKSSILIEVYNIYLGYN